MSKNKVGLVMKYFVLNPTKDSLYGTASQRALLAYADTIVLENSPLAGDIRRWVRECIKELDDE